MLFLFKSMHLAQFLPTNSFEVLIPTNELDLRGSVMNFEYYFSKLLYFFMLKKKVLHKIRLIKDIYLVLIFPLVNHFVNLFKKGSLPLSTGVIKMSVFRFLNFLSWWNQFMPKTLFCVRREGTNFYWYFVIVF